MNHHYNIIVHGQVQGVSYRVTTKEKADQLGVKGTIQNLPDETVQIKAEGSSDQMDHFLAYCHEGSCCAVIDLVQVETGDVIGYEGFDIIE
ncbi:MAG: acylphosphatase [Candidatus Gracilibacteria bacterium]|nr:acylphosphatase [Candidatus Gracilibacteria bacterium]